MSDEMKAAIATLQKELATQEEEVANTKRLINQLAKRAGMSALYADAELQARGGLAMRRDQFYGQPLHTAMRAYLEMRRAVGAATVNEIYDALSEGGFKFEAKSEENAKRIIRITLTKNSGIFHKLPEGNVYGLLAWYPNAKAPKGKVGKEDAGDDGAGANGSDAEDDGEAEPVDAADESA